MFNFHTNHRFLLVIIASVFFGLSMIIAILPAYTIQENVQPLPGDTPFTDSEIKGLGIYIAEGCVACHTQQVRNIEMDNTWGERPSMPSDYYYSKQIMNVWQQSPSLLGSERTGPDLTNVGARQPGKEWHLLHLYNPRLVVEESVMPGYPWLFTEKKYPAEKDVVVQVPENLRKDSDKKVVATEEALYLVDYLLSLKQVPVGHNPGFISSRTDKKADAESEGKSLISGEELYISNCASCHQKNGAGIPGAFPSLNNSEVVNRKDPEKLIRIILQGYDARAEYGIMPAFSERLTDEEIAAISSYERQSWNNNAEKVSPEMVAKIRKLIETETIQ